MFNSVEETPSPENEERKYIRRFESLLENPKLPKVLSDLVAVKDEKSETDQGYIKRILLNAFHHARFGRLKIPYLEKISIFSQDEMGQEKKISSEIRVHLKPNSTDVLVHVDDSGKVMAKVTDENPQGELLSSDLDFFQKYVSPATQKVNYYDSNEADATFQDWKQFVAQFKDEESPSGEVRKIAAMFRAFVRTNQKIQSKLKNIDRSDLGTKINASNRLKEGERTEREVSLGDEWTKMGANPETGLQPAFSGSESISLTVHNDKLFFSVEQSAGTGKSELIPPGGGVDKKDKILKALTRAQQGTRAVGREMAEEHGVKSEDIQAVALGETFLETSNGKEEIANYSALYSLVIVKSNNEYDDALKQQGDEQIAVGSVELGIWDLIALISNGYTTEEGSHVVDDRIIASLVFTLAKFDTEEVNQQLADSGNTTVVTELQELNTLLSS